MAKQEHINLLRQGTGHWNSWRKTHQDTRPDLSGAFLIGANLIDANLNRADLSGADLSDANLSGAVLSGANLSGATIGGTHFASVDLRPAERLETLTHNGPSHISIDTIYKSQGMISEVFLRKAGVSDDFITYMRSLVTKPIDYYTCFISYSSKDQHFVERLYADLQNRGVRCWYAPEDLNVDDKIRIRI